jgi:NTE family protein
MRHFNINVGDVVTQKQLRSAIDRVYALDAFEQVNASFFDKPQGRTIILNTDKKSWGPNYINIGLSIKSDFSKDSIFSFNLAYLLKDITPNGGQWLNEVQLGWETQLATELYQPLTLQQDYFVRGRFEYSLDKWEATSGRSEITKAYFQGNLSLGINYSDYGVIEAGILGEKGDISPDSPDTQKYDYRSLGGYVTLNYDTLNSINFPTQGHKFSFDVLMRNDKYTSSPTNGNNEDSTQVKLDYRGAFGFDNHTIVGIGSFSTVVTDNDFTVHLSELGGFLNLSAHQQDILIGAHKAFGALVYQYDLGRTVPGSAELPIYIGTSIEVGQIWQLKDSVSLNNVITSGSLYVGTDTSFGPAVFGVGFSIDGEYTAFLSIGKNW